MSQFEFTASSLVKFGSGNGAGAQNDFRIGDKIYVAALRNETGDIIVEHVANLNGSKAFDPQRVVHNVGTSDGHAEPSALLTKDGTIVVMNSVHNGNQYYAATISVADFKAGKDFDVDNIGGDLNKGRLTYAWGAYEHSTEPGDPIYAFMRAGKPWGPNVTVSRDEGQSWSSAQLIIEEPGRQNQRPYIDTAHTTNGQGDVTHVFTNRGHPNKHNGKHSQGIYHMELRDGNFYAKGKKIDLPADPLKEMNVISPAGHAGIYDIARDEGYIGRYPKWGNTWSKDAVATDGRAYVLWAEVPKDNNLPEQDVPQQIWWAGQDAKGNFQRHYVTTVNGSFFAANDGAAIDPSSPGTVYVIDDDAKGVQQIYRYDLGANGFEMTRKLTDISTGITGLMVFDDVPGAVYAASYHDENGNPTVQVGPDIWDRQREGFLIPNDRTTKDIPDGPRTYKVNATWDSTPTVPTAGAGDQSPPADDPTPPPPADDPTPPPPPPADDPTPPPSGSGSPVDLSGAGALGNGQDDGSKSVSDGGSTLTLTGNAWKAVNGVFQIASETVLRFTFESGEDSEMQAIALAKGGNIAQGALFEIAAEDNWRDSDKTLAGQYSHGQGAKTYDLEIGRILDGKGMLGAYDQIVFVNDDDTPDDGNVSDATWSDLVFYGSSASTDTPPSTDKPAPPPSGSGSPVDLSGASALGNGQDDGSKSVADGGSTLTLTGNAWKAVDGLFQIVDDTVLRFTFESGEDAEMQAIALAKGGNIAQGALFEIAAEDNWRDSDKTLAGQYSHGQGAKTYDLEIGRILDGKGMLGTYDQIVFVNDDDTPDDGNVSDATWSDLALF